MKRQLELSAAYARLTLQTERLAPSDILKGTGLDAADLVDLEYIDWQVLAAMYRNLDRKLSSPAWAAQMGARFHITAHGPLGFAALSAPTLGDALDVMVTLYPARNNAIGVEVKQADGRYILTLLDLTGDAQFHRQMGELVLQVLESLLSTILGHPVGPNVVVGFAYSTPDYLPELEKVFDGRLEFSSEQFSISIPEAWRRLPSPLHDEDVYRTNIIKCRELIAEREQNSSIESVLRSVLSNHFDKIIVRQIDASPPPTLAQVADSMHLTSRTLIRRLKITNNSYKSILRELREAYACRLLGDAKLTIGDVSEILGYRDAANFSRAFSSWYGMSPGKWRRN